MTGRNVVLVTFDSLRADHCTPWGYERDTTPTLAEWADDGVVFENAIAPASRTNPSMAGIFTGEPLVVRDRVANPEHARTHLARHGTLAETLSNEGYATGAFCPNAYSSRYYGFDRGFDHFEDFMFDSSVYQRLFDRHLGDSSVLAMLRNVRNFVRRQEAFKTWDTYIDGMVEWVDQQSEPFFLWAFSLDTHFPYLTPRKYRQWSGFLDQYYYNWRCNQLIDEFEIDLSEKERRKIIDIYDDSIHFGDALLAELEQRLADYDPVFVVHGDHGEAFDERGIYGHFYPSLYEENIHVPLVVSNVDERASISRPASLLDLPEMVERACGLADEPVCDATNDWALATDYDGRNDRTLTAFRTTTLKYLATRTDGTDHRELFDLSSDADEQDNLAGSDHPAERPLRRLMDRRHRHEAETVNLKQRIDSLQSV